MTTDPDPAPDFDVAALFDRIPIPLYATARDGRVLAANRAFWEVFATPDDHKGATRTDDLYADPTERGRVISEIDKSGIEIIDWEQVIDTPKGIRWIKPLSRVVRDEEGKMVRYEGGFLTVTPMPDAGSVEQQQRILLERTADTVVIVDPSGRLVWANAAARKFLEITEASVQARPLLDDLVESNVPVLRGLATAPSRGNVRISVNGRPYHYWINLEVHLGSDGEPAFYSYIGRDLEALDRTYSQLAESAFLRERLVATVGHELRTPLTSVLGLSEVLLERLRDTGDTESADLAAVIAREAADIASIVDDLLETAESRRERAAPEPLDLRREVMESLRTCGFQEGEVAVSGEASAMGDGSRVRQIIRNLLLNSRRHGEPPISVSLDMDDGVARLQVLDHGPGVPNDLLQSIFEPWVSQGGVKAEPALGLGLTVSRSLAHDMDGSLEYAHIDGVTVFDLRLPVAPE